LGRRIFTGSALQNTMIWPAFSTARNPRRWTLGDEGVAPHVAVDVAAGAAYHLAVAHQSAAENIGKESLGGHVRWRLFHMARNATRWLTTP
jgi:pantothenate kinase